MEGGHPGALGRNTWVKQPRSQDGDLVDPSERPPLTEITHLPNANRERNINIGGKATVYMGKGDKLLIETPGAGAWGLTEEEEKEWVEDHSHVKAWAARGSLAERAAAQAGF